MKKLSFTVFISAFALILLGLIIVMSASSTYSEVRFDSSFYLFNSHFFKVLFGIFLMILFSFIPYEIYRDFSKILIIATALLLVVTLFFAANMKGAGRWISFGFITFQPADAAKLTLLMHLAYLIEDKREAIKDYKNGFLYLFFWIAAISGLILIQPNISNGIIIAFTGLTVIYVGGARLRHIAFSSFIFLIFGAASAMFFSHSRNRIISFINSLHTGGDLNIQVKQAILGLGSGGVFGVGIGHSRQSNLFLPEAYGDFIFSILGEEMGFIGAVLVILIYLVLFAAGILIAKKTKNTFGQLLAFGISFSIIISAFINVAVTAGLLPTTGLPLPFISYGGTSLTFLCIAVGILVNIGLSNSVESNVEQKIEMAV